jgi:hypothetical protein
MRGRESLHGDLEIETFIFNVCREKKSMKRANDWEERGRKEGERKQWRDEKKGGMV